MWRGVARWCQPENRIDLAADVWTEAEYQLGSQWFVLTRAHAARAAAESLAWAKYRTYCEVGHSATPLPAPLANPPLPLPAPLPAPPRSSPRAHLPANPCTSRTTTRIAGQL